jgi:methionyl-tRNA formyltransferase
MPKNGHAHSSLPAQPAQVQFWGLPGEFTAAALDTLLSAGIIPRTVIISDRLPGRSITQMKTETKIPLPMYVPAGPPDIYQLAAQHQIPIFTVGDLQHPETIQTLTANRPDIAIVACFDRRIPQNILAIPRLGFINMHPSLLPTYRGPAPLFWLFRDAATEAMGVTVHQMDAQFDTGDILFQQPLTFPDGVSGREAEQLCARAGAALIAEGWTNLLAGNITTRKQPAGGSSQPWPTAADFTINTSWSARRAFNFMRATADWRSPYPIHVNGKWIHLRQALSFAPKTPSQALRQEGNTVHLRFRPGTLRATIA